MTSHTPSRHHATGYGLVAVLLWALLAPLTVLGGALPPFFTTALAFAVAATIGLVMLKVRGKRWRAALAPDWRQWLFGVSGLFGFHALYFAALAHAPAVEASLIIYLWPLLIVLLQALLPGGRLTVLHGCGALAGLLGTSLLVTRDGLPEFALADLDGYLLALAAAVTWASYSVFNRFVGRGQELDVVTGFCGLTSVLAFAAHFLFEPPVAAGLGQYLAIMGLGLGPVGLAFFVWDVATKHGDLKTLGVLAYLAPLFSTLILVVMGEAEPDWQLALACLAIIGGAALASGDLFRVRRREAR